MTVKVVQIPLVSASGVWILTAVSLTLKKTVLITFNIPNIVLLDVKDTTLVMIVLQMEVVDGVLKVPNVWTR